MASAPIFIDVTTTLQWAKTTAVGIVRVEHYLTRRLLETYPGRIGFAVFDKNAMCFRSAAPEEAALVLEYLYGAASDPAPKPSKLRRLQSLGFSEVKDLSSQFFDARLQPLFKRVRAPHVVTRLSNSTFSHAAAVASLAIKALPQGSADQEPEETSAKDRILAPIEPFRDGRTADTGWLLMAGLTWDYMYYPHLHQLAKASRLKAAHVIYDTIPLDMPQFVPHAGHVYHRHFVEVAQTARALYAISEFSAQRFQAAVLEPNLIDTPIRAHGLPDFLLEAASGEEKATPQLRTGGYALYCSTIEARKNHLLLVNVWQRLLETLPPAQVPKLVLVGKWGWGFEAVKNQIELNPILQDHVVVLSALPDSALVWLYRNAAFSVFPSFMEGWGLAASESLALGTPVLISTTPALNEAAQGLMPRLDPFDFNAWVAAVTDLIVNPEALPALKEKAKAFKPLPVTSFADGLIDMLTAEARA